MRKRQQQKRWKTPKKIKAFIRFNTLPGSYFSDRKKRLARKRKANYF